MSSQYYSVTARVGVPHRNAVEVTIPLVGPQGPVGPQGAQGPPGEVSGSIAWDNVSGKPSAFTPSSHTHVAANITDFAAAVAAVSPPVDWNSLTGKPATFAPSAHTHTPSEVGLGNVSNTAQVTSVTGTAPIVSSGGTTPAISISAATTSAAGSMSSADKTKLDGIAAGAEVNVNADWNASSGDAQILNKPTSLTPTAHAASHASAGSDPVTPASIGAQSIFDTLSSSIPITGALQLSAARARSVTVENNRGEARDVYLPISSIQAGDVFVIIGGATLNTTVTVKVPASGGAAIIDPENTPSGSPVVISATGQQYRFIVTNPANFNPWRFVSVDTHTHAASAITSGTLAHERGGLEADVSAYNGLLKISGGSTSAVTVSATGESVIGAADAAAARSAISAAAATHTHTASAISDSTTAGRALLTAADATAQRTSLGLAAIATSGSASDLGSGTVPIGRLGASGTPSGSTYLAGDNSWKAVTGGVSGVSGSVDNAIIRADGTGGSQVQSSDLTISDFTTAVAHPYVAISANPPSWSVTGVASTSTFTITGHNFVLDQPVAFTALTGGSGVIVNRPYFVRDVSGSTFKLAFSRGGGALSLSTDLTAGTLVSVANIALIPRFGGLSLQIPDGTTLGGNSRGVGAVDLQTARGAASQVASGDGTFIAGSSSSTATGGCVVGCNTSSASGAGSGNFCSRDSSATNTRSVVLGGNQNTCSGEEAVVLGGFGNTASATNAVAFGRGALANRLGIMAHGCIIFGAAGDAQRIRAVLRCKTTDGTTGVEMALDGNTTYLTIPSGKVMYGEIYVVGVRSTGADVALYTIRYAAKNVGGTSTEVFSSVTTDAATGTSLTITTQDTGDYISIKPVGVASQTWRWVAKVDMVEVAYGT